MMRYYTITVRSTEPGWADAKRRAAIVTDRECYRPECRVEFIQAQTFVDDEGKGVVLTFREVSAATPETIARAADEEREGTA